MISDPLRATVGVILLMIAWRAEADSISNRRFPSIACSVHKKMHRTWFDVLLGYSKKFESRRTAVARNALVPAKHALL